MKQKDFIAVIGTVLVSAIFAFVLVNKLLGSSSKDLTAEVVTPITAEFNLPDGKIFNVEAINPTKLIEISPNNNNEPFANQ